ncbi:MAG TPA: DUF2911 domain-containing protein [Candidatus Sulfotelmatobacter sp.]|jgi:hypothetical protein
MQKKIALSTVFIFAVAAACFAQSRPSPAASATCDLGGGKSIKSDYSSPRMKGRKIYGDLVPYGQVWRTGANEATTFVTDTDVTVGGKHVPAGSYTLFTVPNADGWKLIINKKTGEWGIPYKYESDELVRVDMKVSKLSAPMENFTISYAKEGHGCVMHIDWDSTRASVDITGGAMGDKMRQ